jgi:tRNA threonylcarbamoyl adenosine modification protein YeaZ
MRYLVVDRSTCRPGMAVFEGNKLILEQTWDGEPTRAPEWVAWTAETLAAHGLSVRDMDAFVSGLGPGSFSGIRACLSALQGMALPLGAPLFGVASAAAVALGHADGAEEVTVVGDARRNRLWCVSYRLAAGGVKLSDGRAPTHTAADFTLVPVETLAQAVPAGTKILTSDWDRIQSVLSSTFAADRLVPHAVYPLAADVGRLALADPDARVSEPLPIYLHPAVAEKAETAATP